MTKTNKRRYKHKLFNQQMTYLLLNQFQMIYVNARRIWLHHAINTSSYYHRDVIFLIYLLILCRAFVLGSTWHWPLLSTTSLRYCLTLCYSVLLSVLVLCHLVFHWTLSHFSCQQFSNLEDQFLCLLGCCCCTSCLLRDSKVIVLWTSQ